ncbi:MAG: LamG-like jellyroll fold domain-containing protein [Kiritimatiellia bacterium]|nr:LamG-like jellyroll fold domain-containing protein [Kiritimatiellia bacterium]
MHHLNALAAAPGSASVSDLVNMTFVEAVLGLGAKTVSTANGGFEFNASEVAKGITDPSRFTVSMVVKVWNGYLQHGRRFATNKTAYNGPGFDVMYFSSSTVKDKITVRGDNANKTAHFDPSGIDWTQPHHLAIVFDGDTCACYVDGTPLTTDGVATSAAIDPVSTHANTLYLGKNSDLGTVLPGIYDEFRLRNGAATPEDIACEYADLMNAGAGLYTLRADLGAPTILYFR